MGKLLDCGGIEFDPALTRLATIKGKVIPCADFRAGATIRSARLDSRSHTACFHPGAVATIFSDHVEDFAWVEIDAEGMVVAQSGFSDPRHRASCFAPMLDLAAKAGVVFPEPGPQPDH